MIGPYILKSGLCLVVLLGFYKLVLENTALHTFKRYFLLGSLLFSMSIPLVTFTYTVAVDPQPLQGYTTIVTGDPIIQAELETTNYIPYLLWSIYGLGLILFGSRFIWNLIRLKRKINAAQWLPKPQFTLALLAQDTVPHSFLKWILLSRKRYENQEIPPEVIAHEATHVRQKHSLDILFIEVLQVVFWFNPLFWLTKNAIKLNHEFLADQGVLREENDIIQYQNILFGYAKGTDHSLLESAINYSLTKKRIVMLSKTISRKRAALSAFLLIPVLATCALLFNQEIVEKPKEVAVLYADSSEEKLYARSIELNIVDQKHYQVEGRKIRKEALLITLNSLHTDLTKAQRDRVINLHIKAKDKVPFKELQSIQQVAAQYGYHRIVTPFQEIVRAKGNDPVQWSEQETDPNNIQYAKNYLAGAEQNGKKAIVISIQGNSVYVNGKASSLATFKNDIDASTKDWEEPDYTAAFPSVLVKNPSKGFIDKLNSEFLKTHLSKANGGMSLLPPPPPPPPAPVAPGSSQTSPSYIKINGEDHIKVISQGETKIYNKFGEEVDETGKLQNASEIQNPASKKEIATYNRLAKKYNGYNGGEIKQGEVVRMYDIYSRMTAKQKKKAETYPVLPPPPPPPPAPAPIKVVKGEKSKFKVVPGQKAEEKKTKFKVVPGKKVIKGQNDGDKKNPPPPPPPPPPKKTKYILNNGQEASKAEPVIIEIREEKVRPQEEEEIEIIEVIEVPEDQEVIIVEEVEQKVYPTIKEVVKEDSDQHDVEINVNDLIKEDATFYLNDKKISNAKARKLFNNTKNLSKIEVSKPKNGKPIVSIWNQ